MGQLLADNLLRSPTAGQGAYQTITGLPPVSMGGTGRPETLPCTSSYFQFAAKIAVQYFGQFDAAIGLLVVFHERDDHSRQGQSRTV